MSVRNVLPTLLIASAFLLSTPAIALTLDHAQSKNRVGGQNRQDHVGVGAQHDVSPRLHRGNLGVATTIASGCSLAQRGLGKLTWLGDGRWRSTAGLIYGQGSKHGNRVKHVLDHLSANAAKPLHTVFNVGRRKILGLIDEAWKARGVAIPGDPGAFIVNMKRVVGAAGETAIKIVVQPGTSNIITAFPVVP